jgi:hypothetical protein
MSLFASSLKVLASLSTVAHKILVHFCCYSLFLLLFCKQSVSRQESDQCFRPLLEAVMVEYGAMVEKQ